LMARRPRQLAPRPSLQQTQIDDATYLGSAEHKSEWWWNGLPLARVGQAGTVTRPKKQRTTICPLVTEADRQKATLWVRAALCAGQYRYLEADKVFPGRVWYHQDDTDQFWIGYCINTIQGQYKGWPVDEDEIIAIFG